MAKIDLLFEDFVVHELHFGTAAGGDCEAVGEVDERVTFERSVALVGSQAGDHGRLFGVGNDVRDEPGVALVVRVRGDRGVLDSGVGPQCHLDFLRLDPHSAHLRLGVEPAEELYDAVGAATRPSPVRYNRPAGTVAKGSATNRSAVKPGRPR